MKLSWIAGDEVRMMRHVGYGVIGRHLLFPPNGHI